MARKPLCTTSRTIAFTLIELLVVVAVITLLLSILLPSLQDAREKAKQTVCSNNIRQIATCLAMYALENNDTFAPAVMGTYSNPGTWKNIASDDYYRDYPGMNYWTYSFGTAAALGKYYNWKDYIFPYTGRSGSVFECTSDLNRTPIYGGVPFSNYVYNPSVSGFKYTYSANLFRSPAKTNAVRNPSSIFLIMDFSYQNDMDMNPDALRYLGTFGHFTMHSGGFNVGFIDGHTTWVPQPWPSEFSIPPLHDPPDGRVPVQNCNPRWYIE